MSEPLFLVENELQSLVGDCLIRDKYNASRILNKQPSLQAVLQHVNVAGDDKVAVRTNGWYPRLIITSWLYAASPIYPIDLITEASPVQLDTKSLTRIFVDEQLQAAR